MKIDLADSADKKFLSFNHDWNTTAHGCTVIRALDFLNGQPFDNLAIAYIHALRPSMIRVSTGEVTTDGWMWRVTVMLKEDNLIDYICQEVAVGFASGYEIDCVARRRGINLK